MQASQQFWYAVAQWRRGEEEMGRLLPSMDELDTADRERLLTTIRKLSIAGNELHELAQGRKP